MSLKGRAGQWIEDRRNEVMDYGCGSSNDKKKRLQMKIGCWDGASKFGCLISVICSHFQ